MQSLRYFKSPTLMPTDILSIFIVIGFYPAKLRIFFEFVEDIERKMQAGLLPCLLLNFPNAAGTLTLGFRF